MIVYSGIYGSRAASFTLGAVFAFVTLCHILLMFWKRVWFMLFMIIGCVLEVSGYFSEFPGDGSQSAEVLIAPLLLAESVRNSFGELLRTLSVSELVPINNTLQSLLFAFADIICLGLIIAGFVLGRVRDDGRALGRSFIMAGLALQLVGFLCFSIMVIIVHKKLFKSPYYQGGKGYIGWRNFFAVLYIATVLFFIRNVYRLVEYALGWGGYVFNHAVFAYVLDGMTMIFVSGLFVLVHPGLVLSRLRVAAAAGDNLYEL